MKKISRTSDGKRRWKEAGQKWPRRRVHEDLNCAVHLQVVTRIPTGVHLLLFEIRKNGAIADPVMNVYIAPIWIIF
jgi:hypothetical protein